MKLRKNPPGLPLKREGTAKEVSFKGGKNLLKKFFLSCSLNFPDLGG